MHWSLETLELVDRKLNTYIVVSVKGKM